jgi:hypothetical protein
VIPWKDKDGLTLDACRVFLTNQRARLRNQITDPDITPERRELLNQRINNLLNAEQAYKKEQAKILGLDKSPKKKPRTIET